MFQTMLAKQPGYQVSGYKLFEAGFATLAQLQRGRLSEWPKSDRNRLYDVFRAGWEKLQDEVANASQNGKQALIKEHTMFLSGPDKLFATLYEDDEVDPLVLQQRDEPLSTHTNPTSLPDRFLRSMQPIFQIRHPALMFPSMVRAQSNAPLENTTTRNPRVFCCFTLRPTRELYNWYLEHASALTPRLIDADDIMNDPAAVRQLCIETGLDPDAVQYEWEEKHEENPLKASFLSTINKSTGIVKGLDARNLDIEKEKRKWIVDFGDDAAEDLEKAVREAMPDYEYLLSRRTRSKQASALA
ncbi:hypothetical protein EK21DRAFT_73227 [Setomelanomma holmii]|uniref:Sulfotransferase n=1 Tax=Setomelanomma holmii TaxID=210430 RepID=A0A9P4H3A9_9PLEO|nr:hypothetical protein EK21DRAFT_73227 [Setomelanomma holmii]